ncbi:Hypothetical_protein [Hexamita inflata]|uniref:Hypothetical_protein n=1 Tax=Hexamita inflata TaxID=28002 RepID=A0AA86TBZ3_9EUKA|nr:Hypothetical protein HINF_LOCUS1246 [Hexamita inflata]
MCFHSIFLLHENEIYFMGRNPYVKVEVSLSELFVQTVNINALMRLDLAMILNIKEIYLKLFKNLRKVKKLKSQKCQSVQVMNGRYSKVTILEDDVGINLYYCREGLFTIK